jgi:protein ImuB
MPICLLETNDNVSRLMELARISLGTGRLPGLVSAISLQANPHEFASSPARDLFGERPDAVSRLSLLDLLRVRLGSDAVHGIRAMAEHRPEYAWRPLQEPDRGGDAADPLTARASRPLWMLPEPLRLRAEEGRPVFHGALTLLAGPERIETGWWDGGDIRRDYHLACNQRGIRIWIFRDLREDAWYLHGLFG